MKAAVYYTNEDIRVEELPIPQSGAGEIVVRTSACGDCPDDRGRAVSQMHRDDGGR